MNIQANKTHFHKSNRGYCTICEAKTRFIEYSNWKRDTYKCNKCRSIPRNRAIIYALNRFFPTWYLQTIHECSPSEPTYSYFRRKCSDYTCSQYFTEVSPGDSKNGFRCENIEQMRFQDKTFDIFITQDVLEHIFEPIQAFKEISRVLKPSGVHIFTVPLYMELAESRQRAMREQGEIIHLHEAMYHSNPVDPMGSLVTFDYGSDLIDRIYDATKMSTTIYLVHDKYYGLDGEFLEVFISRK